MDNNTNTSNQGNAPEQQGNNAESGAKSEDRTFTQDQVNGLMNERIAEIKSKYADYDDLKEKAKKYDEAQEASKTELQKATDQRDAYKKELDDLKKANKVNEIRQKVAAEKKVPANLLTADTEEDCQKQADDILKFAKPDGYPAVPEDRGEIRRTGKQSMNQMFAGWASNVID